MQTKDHTIVRPPVIAIMGHVDHGKSTLLDFIRKSNVVEGEAGGITQKISAYEVNHTGTDGKEHRITFLDTPGHEAFKAIRSRGAKVADVAVLVVSAEDGVRPQTIEARDVIRAAGIPMIVAINKIDKEGADVMRTKNSLAENDIYVEGYGGTVSCVEISAKTGQGVPDLLDVVLLAAEVEELRGEPSKPAEGVVIEANLDKKKGLSATLVVKDGTVRSGQTLVAGTAISPVRIMENFLGKPIKEATFSSPIRIIGWNELPEVGATWRTFDSKKEAEAFVANSRLTRSTKAAAAADAEDKPVIPIVLKASEVGGLEALEHEIGKIRNEKVRIRVIQKGVGDITENDVKAAGAREHTIILGFNTKVDASARSLAEKMLIDVRTFDIIYKLSEWLVATVEERAPKIMVDEATGTAKVLKIFSKTRDRQILGGRVENGALVLGAEVKIVRRDFEVGRGRVRELQRQKNRVDEVPEGQEFGAMVESKIEIAPGDRLESFRTVEK